MTTRTVITKHKWKVDNVIQRLSDTESTISIVGDVFPLNGKSGLTVSMCIGRGTLGYHQSYLVCTQFGRDREMQLSVKSWYKGSDGEMSWINENTLTFNKAGSASLLTTYSTSCMISFAVANTFTIHCEIQHEESIEDDSYELIDRSEFGQNVHNLHSDGYFDLTIQVEGKEFKANKIILMRYSKVFRSMLTFPNSIEVKTGIIKIENTKAEVIDAMIRWIYHVKVENMNGLALDLYRAADKYDIALLKKVCINDMAKSLSNLNVPARIILAYDHNESNLKESVINFISYDIKRAQSLMASGEWMEYCGKYPESAQKIVADVFSQFS